MSTWWEKSYLIPAWNTKAFINKTFHGILFSLLLTGIRWQKPVNKTEKNTSKSLKLPSLKAICWKKTNEDIVPQSSVILQTIVGLLVGSGEGRRRRSSKKALFRAVPGWIFLTGWSLSRKPRKGLYIWFCNSWSCIFAALRRSTGSILLSFIGDSGPAAKT